MVDEDDFCDWFLKDEQKKFSMQNEELMAKQYPLLKEAPSVSKRFSCTSNDQHVIVTYVGCIPPEKTLHENWNPYRTERIAEWATPEKLQRTFTVYDTSKIVDITRMPRISRVHTYPNVTEKFTIDDGNHRMTWAEEHKVPCVMAEVAEGFIMKHRG